MKTLSFSTETSVFVERMIILLTYTFAIILVHLVLPKFCGQLVGDHVSLERSVHKVHCHCELIPGQGEHQVIRKVGGNL